LLFFGYITFIYIFIFIFTYFIYLIFFLVYSQLF